ncbi:MAG TPA: 50S ribosomal protein L32e [Pyrodictium sp.]|nr:50S ribosomal protein L32e [Pyrodictium sp.]
MARPSGEELQRLLRLRKKLKSRKPEFLRTLWWKFPKFKNDPKWRKPKGIDNKMRLRLKGYPPIVEVGYRGPAAVRGLHPTGLEPVLVHSEKELEGLDPSKHIVVIASTVGLKKRLKILEKARQLGLRVANE